MPARSPVRPQVDIVINNHNYAQYLRPAVDSALNQTHPAVNVIVVDDGSTDDSRARLEAYGDRIEVVLKSNGGQASAINAGAARCTGDVIMFLDSDDMLEPHAAERVAEVFEADPAVVKVQFRMAIIDAAGRPTGVIKPPPHLPLPAGDVREAELSFPFDLVWQPTSANAYRADAVRRVLPIPEDEYPRCTDWYLNHLTSLLGEVVSLEEVGARYRMHGRNSYEPQSQNLDLEHVRETIGYARATTRELQRLASELGYDGAGILSLADLAARLVSLRMDRRRHPIPDDRVPALLAGALRAATRRKDVAPLMRFLFAGWFLLTAVAPRPLVRRLGEIFVFHELRGRGLNWLIRRMHRLPAETAPTPQHP